MHSVSKLLRSQLSAKSDSRPGSNPVVAPVTVRLGEYQRLLGEGLKEGKLTEGAVSAPAALEKNGL
jgi:hypothetical protein